ncbi:hypothetical protein B0H34DRAFT_677847 [Crassisporium funariophilum]|nr:hypothetical protein B0H34DRAFT_677847 [Crassisporium funariophilum]
MFPIRRQLPPTCTLWPCITLVLHPGKKLAYFQKNWDEWLVDNINKLGCEKIEEQYWHLNTTGNNPSVLSQVTKNKRPGLVQRRVDSDSEDKDKDGINPQLNPSKPCFTKSQYANHKPLTFAVYERTNPGAAQVGCMDTDTWSGHTPNNTLNRTLDRHCIGSGSSINPPSNATAVGKAAGPSV